MHNRLIIMFFISFFCVGCIPYFLFNPVEKEARQYMQKAAFYKKISRFESAVKEYAIVIEKYSGTSYYKKAVYNSALINMDSKNSKADYDMALLLIRRYLELSLSKTETRTAKNYEALLIQINSNEKFIGRQKKDIKAYKAQKEELKDKLQKIKEIDVQMHENKLKHR